MPCTTMHPPDDAPDEDVRTLRPETRAAQLLGVHEPGFRGLIPAIYPATSFLRAPDGTYPGGHVYTRDQNPGYAQVERLLAELDAGADALLFASGMAAAAALLEALAPGAHVIAPRQMYWTLRGFLEQLSTRGRLALSWVDAGDLEAVERALRARTAQETLVWAETPSNPLMYVTDLTELARVAHAHGARVAADATLATPVLMRPIEHGVDFVFHSATKQLNGHGDVLAGALVCKQVDAWWERVRVERAVRGAVLGPFETWLLQRGLRTLHLRVRQSSQSALAIAEALADHPACLEVLYPGLSSHPAHALCARQMRGGFGPMLSLRVRGGQAAARRVLAGLRVFKDATSLGSVESLVEHRASVEGEHSELPRDLLRLSIGIEHTQDLIDDLHAALGALGETP